MTLPTKETVEMLRSGYPNGTRVRLVKMNDPQAPPVGTEGTVCLYFPGKSQKLC